MAIEDFIRRHGGLTEEYKFYDGEVTLRYDPADHVYLLQTPKGDLEMVDGVTNVCHIIDKSNALLPWGVKMMAQKLFRTVPTHDVRDGTGDIVERYVLPMTLEAFEKLVLDAKDAHKDKLEDAGEVGHTAHAWIEEYIKADIASKLDNFVTARQDGQARKSQLLANRPKDERAANACSAALQWMRNHNVRWISTEQKIYSRHHKYAGTMDGLCRVDSCSDPRCCPEPFKDRLTIADWKTSNYLYLEYVFQTSAYMKAFNEERIGSWKHGDPEMELATDRWIIRLGKDDGEFEPWHLDESTFADDFAGFEEALALTRRVRKIGERISQRKADLRAALKAERDAARAKKEAEEKAERERIREQKKADKIAAHSLACPESKNYKGKRSPTCTSGKDGGPCVSHAFKYAKAQEDKSGSATISENSGSSIDEDV